MRLLFFGSIYFTAKIFFYEEDAAQERSKAGQSGEGTGNENKSDSEAGGGRPPPPPATET